MLTDVIAVVAVETKSNSCYIITAYDPAPEPLGKWFQDKEDLMSPKTWNGNCDSARRPYDGNYQGVPAEICENCGEILWAQTGQRYHLTETRVGLIV